MSATATVVGGLSRHRALIDVEAILFDKDGTLLDFEATWGPATTSVLRSLSEGDATLFADLAAACGFRAADESFAPSSPIIGGDTDDFAPAWATRLGRRHGPTFTGEIDALYRQASLEHLTAYDDVAPALARLRAAGLPIGLASNDSERTARAHLDRLGVSPLFDFVAGYDTGHGAKPGPGMVLAFAAAVGLPPAKVALVGDSPHDIGAAVAAGAAPVGIARTAKARAALDGMPPLTVTSLGEFLETMALATG